MPSNWYARKDASVNGLLQSLADDLTNLFHNGVTVNVALFFALARAFCGMLALCCFLGWLS